MNSLSSKLPSGLLQIILADDPAQRDLCLSECCKDKSIAWLQQQCTELDNFRRKSDNLYHQVRALFFLSAIYRYHLPKLLEINTGKISFDGFNHLLNRRFPEAIDEFQKVSQNEEQLSDATCSALAESFYKLAFQRLADQVKSSVQSFHGNEWMFQTKSIADLDLKLQSNLLDRSSGNFPTLIERTPVRMDLSHSAWSDIFFLGMDYPEGARVINVSVDLGVQGRDESTAPPIEAYLRVIDKPVLRLESVDLKTSVELTKISQVFNFAEDYLGLLRAAVIASGMIPPGLENSEGTIAEVFEKMIGPGLGIEIISKVNGIPKGSRLAVSTNLLGALISACMRATGQIENLEGTLEETDRRLIAARAILGEWLGGSGGGWQDSGGVWPGIKLIAGIQAQDGDPEHKISRGCLLPKHHLLNGKQVSMETRQKLTDSLVVVHGGMAQNVGPILEMVTEKYLLRENHEWQARIDAGKVVDEILESLEAGDIRRVGASTMRNFFEPLQTIIPWCSDRFTETLIEATREKFGDDFWGFWMLGGMAGGGMGFIFEPSKKPEAQQWLAKKMKQVKSEMENALPFAMEPVVYNFSINDKGSSAELVSSVQSVSNEKSVEQEIKAKEVANGDGPSLDELLTQNGFDRIYHEQVQADLRSGKIGLAQNRLPNDTLIEDVDDRDLTDTRKVQDEEHIRIGKEAIQNGEVAVVSLAAGIGSRWTQGAGVVKGIHPFCKFGGRHRTFLEVHLAKSRRTHRLYGTAPQHVFTTGYMTHGPLKSHLEHSNNHNYHGSVLLSPGDSVGLRMIPMVRDLDFFWNEIPQQVLDEQQQKVQENLQETIKNWASEAGEGTDYTDNLPLQCLHPVGHWYEIPNLMSNGVLEQMLSDRPQLKYLMLHNIDTLGADLNPAILGLHIERDDVLSFEVIARRLADHGGGLASVNGKPRILEGLALPNERDEFKLRYYNSMTTWINIDKLLKAFGLSKSDLSDRAKVQNAVRDFSNKLKTYVTLKDVKKRWGLAQEDVFKISQFEKLWSDMSALDDIECGFFVVPLERGQQLKDQAQLDGWRRDGSSGYVDSLCDWNEQ